MSTEPEVPATGTEPPAASQRLPDPFTDSELEERADIAEDRRRQRELDDGELGGEA
jgi:hypothetical protein